VSPRRKLQAVPLETPPAPEATALDKVAAWVGQADLSLLKCRARTHVWSEAGGTVKETPAGWWEKDPCVNGCGCHRVTVTDYDGYQVGRPHILYDPDYLLPRGVGSAGRSKPGRAMARKAYMTARHGQPAFRRAGAS
jgi:hypothetical protein